VRADDLELGNGGLGVLDRFAPEAEVLLALSHPTGTLSPSDD
jgi:hypothetical protein